jgi:hypothetical protein
VCSFTPLSSLGHANLYVRLNSWLQFSICLCIHTHSMTSSWVISPLSFSFGIGHKTSFGQNHVAGNQTLNLKTVPFSMSSFCPFNLGPTMTQIRTQLLQMTRDHRLKQCPELTFRFLSININGLRHWDFIMGFLKAIRVFTQETLIEPLGNPCVCVFYILLQELQVWKLESNFTLVNECKTHGKYSSSCFSPKGFSVKFIYCLFSP